MCLTKTRQGTYHLKLSKSCKQWQWFAFLLWSVIYHVIIAIWVQSCFRMVFLYLCFSYEVNCSRATPSAYIFSKTWRPVSNPWSKYFWPSWHALILASGPLGLHCPKEMCQDLMTFQVCRLGYVLKSKNKIFSKTIQLH